MRRRGKLIYRCLQCERLCCVCIVSSLIQKSVVFVSVFVIHKRCACEWLRHELAIRTEHELTHETTQTTSKSIVYPNDVSTFLLISCVCFVASGRAHEPVLWASNPHECGAGPPCSLPGRPAYSAQGMEIDVRRMQVFRLFLTNATAVGACSIMALVRLTHTFMITLSPVFARGEQLHCSADITSMLHDVLSTGMQLKS